MPTPCAFNDTKKYTVRHNPFMFYADINGDMKYCSRHIVPLNKLQADLDSDNLPNFVFISPNICNDMHNCSMATGDKWLSKSVPMILSSSEFTKQRSLLVITWDEGSQSDNRVLTIFLGSAAKESYSSSKPYNHFSLFRTIEYLWDLKPITNNDKHASIMKDMLK